MTIAHMEVPCSFGLNNIAHEAHRKSGKNIPVEEVTVAIGGEKREAVKGENNGIGMGKSWRERAGEMFKSSLPTPLLFS
jgi:hypothetical protein